MENKIVVVVKGLIEHNGKVLLLKRSSTDDVDAGVWETVGGKLDFGEGLEEALVREVKEEAGLLVSVERLLFASSFFTNPHRQIVLLTYLCRAADDQVQLSEEHSDYKWATKSEVPLYLPVPNMADMNKHKALDALELID